MIPLRREVAAYIYIRPRDGNLLDFRASMKHSRTLALIKFTALKSYRISQGLRVPIRPVRHRGVSPLRILGVGSIWDPFGE